MRLWMILSCLAFLAGCSPERAAVPEEAHREIVLLPDSSFEFMGLALRQAQGPGDESMLMLYDQAKRAVYFFDTEGELTKHITLQPPDSLLRDAKMWSVFALNADTVVAVQHESRNLLLFDGSGKFLQLRRANTKLTDQSSDYVLIGLSQSPALSDGKNIYVTCTRMDVVVNRTGARQTYFSTPPDIRFDATGESNTGVWPPEYRSGAPFRDFYPHRCVNGKGQLVYGFAASDSLYVMENDQIVSRHLCKSDYMTERLIFPDDSSGHFDYLARYLVTEPRYLSLTYDPHRQLYYRVVHHAIAYEKEGGILVNDYLDKPWSLMVLDEEFNVLSETRFDPARFPPVVLPVEDGLFLVRRKQKSYITPVTLSLFTINE